MEQHVCTAKRADRIPGHVNPKNRLGLRAVVIGEGEDGCHANYH